MPNDFQCKGRYKLSRISFPLATRDAGRNCIYVSKLCYDEKSAIYTFKVNHSIFKKFLDRKLEHVF